MGEAEIGCGVLTNEEVQVLDAGPLDKLQDLLIVYSDLFDAMAVVRQGESATLL